MLEGKRSWIQGGPSGYGVGGYEVRARLRKWVELQVGSPVNKARHLFDHTVIYREEGRTIIVTEPYIDLRAQDVPVVFAGFISEGWQVDLGASERPAPCVKLTLTSPEGWVLPKASELGLRRDGSMASYFLP